MNRSGVIYAIRFAGNDLVYLGSTVNFASRASAHRRQLRANHHRNPNLQSVFAALGEPAMSIGIVERVEDELFLLAREQFWIWRTPRDHLLNQRVDVTEVYDRTGEKMPAGWSERVSAQMKGNQFRRGIPHSDADKAKISAGLRRAREEGRRPKTDPDISRRNLDKYRALVAAGKRLPAKVNPERIAAIVASYQRTKSYKATGAEFGISGCTVAEHLEKYAPEVRMPPHWGSGRGQSRKSSNPQKEA